MNAEREIAEACLQSLNALKAFAVEPPFFIIVSLVGVKGVLLADPRNFTDRRFDGEVILISEVLLENHPTSKTGLFESLKPAFDEMWNAAGAPGSPNYAENGQRDPKSY